MAGRIPWNFYNFPNEPEFFQFWEDFETTSGADSAATWLTLGWTLSVKTAGTAVTGDTDGVNGIVTLATTAADNNGPQLQRLSETVGLRTGTNTKWISKLQHSIVLTDTWSAGLALTDTTIQHATDGTLANVTDCTDFIGFVSPEADTGLYGIIRRDGVQAATGNLATLANATNVVLAYEIVMHPTTAGTGYVRFFVNGAPVGRLDSATMPYSAEETLAPAVALTARSATGSTMIMDYMGVLQTPRA